MERNLFIRSVLACGMMQASISHSGAFHTIIGPDGHPMVVQVPDRDMQKKSSDKDAEQENEALHRINAPIKQIGQATLSDVQVPEYISTVQELDLQESNRQNVISRLALEHTKNADVQQPIKTVEKIEKSKDKKDAGLSVRPAIIQPANSMPNAIEALPQKNHSTRDAPSVLNNKMQIEAENKSSVPAQPVEIPPVMMQSIQKNEQLNNSKSLFKTLPPELVKKQNIEQPLKPNEPKAGFSAMAGEQYVNSEYLEDREFNLEGKKRFYAMPEGVIDNKIGATRMQMVEREKGVSRSMLESLFKHNQPVDTGPVALSASYYRVSQADVTASLARQCFQEKQIKSAKNLKSGSEANVWPRAPLKDEFDFEVVKVEHTIQNVQINSYASRQNDPTFYWPFVVFLDAQGCVLEGAGGFKNKDGGEDYLRRERIEGVIQIPKNTEYLLLTPLATAIDVEQRALTNHGQLKLIAIR